MDTPQTILLGWREWQLFAAWCHAERRTLDVEAYGEWRIRIWPQVVKARTPMPLTVRAIDDPDPWETPTGALGWFVEQAHHAETCNIHTREHPGTGCTCAFGKCYAKLRSAIVTQEWAAYEAWLGAQGKLASLNTYRQWKEETDGTTKLSTRADDHDGGGTPDSETHAGD